MFTVVDLRPPIKKLHALEETGSGETRSHGINDRTMQGRRLEGESASGSFGHGLDDDGMANYRQRYAELQGELDEAERFNDLGRMDQLKTELEDFELQLARETGLGGRRREKTDADRVRKAVSIAVTRAIDSIRDEHLVLGRHLRNSISLGLTFRYDPERDPNWRV